MTRAYKITMAILVSALALFVLFDSMVYVLERLP